MSKFLSYEKGEVTVLNDPCASIEGELSDVILAAFQESPIDIYCELMDVEQCKDVLCDPEWLLSQGLTDDHEAVIQNVYAILDEVEVERAKQGEE